MNTETGQLVSKEFLESSPVLDRSRFIPVARDLSKLEELDMQIRMWAPCACGSGKKLKFCCYKTPAK